jgi:hypothetical protein
LKEFKWDEILAKFFLFQPLVVYDYLYVFKWDEILDKFFLFQPLVVYDYLYVFKSHLNWIHINNHKRPMVERGKMYHESHLIWIHINNHKRPMVERGKIYQESHLNWIHINNHKRPIHTFLHSFSSFNHCSFNVYLYVFKWDEILDKFFLDNSCLY